MSHKKNIVAYDLFIRVFHWTFAGLFIIAMVIANTVDDEHAFFAYHKMAGLMLMFVTVLRIVWGIFGSKTTRFTSFKFHPKDLLNYFSELFETNSKDYVGHNPASSYSAIAMFILALGLGTTGILMSFGKESEWIEEAHELLANGFLFIVVLHVAGVVLHHARKHDGMAFSMLTGRKDCEGEMNSLPSIFPFGGILFALLTVMMGIYLFSNFDPKTGQLSLIGGTKLQLFESDQEHPSQYNRHNSEENEEDDHDDD